MLKADSKMFHDLCEEGIKDDKKDGIYRPKYRGINR